MVVVTKKMVGKWKKCGLRFFKCDRHAMTVTSNKRSIKANNKQTTGTKRGKTEVKIKMYVT